MPDDSDPTKSERREAKQRAGRKMRVHNASRWQQIRQLWQKRAKPKDDKSG